MTLYVVDCEWNMGFNLDGYSGVYSSEETIQEAIEEADWKSLGEEITNPSDFIDEGWIILKTIEG